MRLQVLVDELGKRQRRRPSARTQPVKRLPKRPLRLCPRRETANSAATGFAALGQYR
jgi:hypothetical protein